MDVANLIPKMYTVTLSLNVLHEHTLGWGTNGFGNGIGDNFPRKFGDTPSPPSTNQEANRAGAGVTAGTPAAVDPNADGVATRQQGTEEQRQSSTNQLLEKKF